MSDHIIHPSKVVPHPTSIASKDDRLRDRENIARQLRTTQMMREAAREQINATQVISEIQEIDLLLQGDKDSAGNIIPPDPDLRAALKVRSEIKFKLLDKVLPNLKSSENVSANFHDHSGTINHKRVSNVELAQRLQLWRKQHGYGHLGRAEESCVEATFQEVEDEEQEFDFL